ncbi:phosphoribosylformylglycinamidine synthase [Candidatus Ichthyocystis hellenicum]|uniref:phosphoribosylformylglycinamidine synthase n=2 Tax=Candidatus Ichthyocystis TaxID=2929841 RepID=UPI000A849B68|nr:phosphoribosylformylglycinamidine synthase [Candidatus Ichthyocystis hellenicum]
MFYKPVLRIMLGSCSLPLPSSFPASLSSYIKSYPLYLVLFKDKIDSSKEKRLHSIFDIKEEFLPSSKTDLWCFVLPRLGSISPWSSKATQLVHNCGFHEIIRIERGVVLFKPEYPIVELEHKILLFDPMTQVMLYDYNSILQLFDAGSHRTLNYIENDIDSVKYASNSYGLCLDSAEIDILSKLYKSWGRSATDAELLMFAQANSEHCRHKIFNASWIIDGNQDKYSLFSLIRQTHASNPNSTVSAYIDNAAILKPRECVDWYVNSNSQYVSETKKVGLAVKVETHNHPTLMEPFSGAATGCGGEIRDESASGRGGFPLAGLCGFSVSNLRIPNCNRHWELKESSVLSPHMSTAWEIMINAPIGASSFNNEFGRPNLCGYFRSFEQIVSNTYYGYYKPIMIAGGMGSVRESNFHKKNISPGDLIIQLGGLGYLIGLGGGSASSFSAGQNTEQIDFSSVQRSNPEMQRRAQEVINYCSALERNPILSIHDVGAGGLANAVPEIVYSSNKGAICNISDIPVGEDGLSPAEIWCNESQERYVLVIHPDDIDIFRSICNRESCPYSVIGKVVDDQTIVLKDDNSSTTPVNFPLKDLLSSEASKKTITTCASRRQYTVLNPVNCNDYSLQDIATEVLRHPTVADKSFLITIGDRTVGGLVYQDQMVGPWQIPVADCSIITSSFNDCSGYAMSMGERSPIAIISPASSARMAISESLTNIVSSVYCNLSSLVLSANWMADFDLEGQDLALREAVEAASSFCCNLNISIPVGKDSLSMSVHKGADRVSSPVTLISSAFAPIDDVRSALTPLLARDDDTDLLLIDLGHGKNRLGNSIFAQITSQIGNEVPDCDDPEDIVRLFSVIKVLKENKLLFSYHDRSDGGLFVTVAEMLFASHIGIDLNIDPLCYDHSITDVDWMDVKPDFLKGPFEDKIVSALFNEELGSVIQTSKSNRKQVWSILRSHGLSVCTHTIGSININHNKLRIYRSSKCIFSEERPLLHKVWSEVSYEISKHRDDPVCAKSALDLILEEERTRLFIKASNNKAATVLPQTRPAVAILREQGSNGQREMAAAFQYVGFDAFDVTMNDLLNSSVNLRKYRGLAVVGGFSYGDVPFAGRGWAHTILSNDYLRKVFQEFFARPDTFSLGVCNGCQMLSQISSLIPGTDLWPIFETNKSRRFEARLVMTKVIESPSIFFDGMTDSCFPTIVSHAEGRASRKDASIVCLRYINGIGEEDDAYPLNPNGSFRGNTGFTSEDGSVTILMPHPERLFNPFQTSWGSSDSSFAPWADFFANAYSWCKNTPH